MCWPLTGSPALMTVSPKYLGQSKPDSSGTVWGRIWVGSPLRRSSGDVVVEVMKLLWRWDSCVHQNHTHPFPSQNAFWVSMHLYQLFSHSSMETYWQPVQKVNKLYVPLPAPAIPPPPACIKHSDNQPCILWAGRRLDWALNIFKCSQKEYRKWQTVLFPYQSMPSDCRSNILQTL